MKLNFSGTARIIESDEAAHRLVLHASGAEDRGRGTADMTITAQLVPSGRRHDACGWRRTCTISGAAAQFGRGMIADVTSVLMASFAECVEHNITQAGSGGTVDRRADGRGPRAGSPSASGPRVMALKRVFARFFLPYDVSRLR